MNKKSQECVNVYNVLSFKIFKGVLNFIYGEKRLKNSLGS